VVWNRRYTCDCYNFIAGFFPILLSTVSGVGNVDAIYLKVADSFGIRQPQMLFKIILPAAFPLIATGFIWLWDQPGVPGGWRNGRCPVRFGISYHRCEEFFKVGFGFGRNNIHRSFGLLLDRLIKLVETGIENSGEYPEGEKLICIFLLREYHGNTFLKAKGRYPLRM